MNLLTVKEASAKLGVTVWRVHQLIKEDKLSAKKLGSQYVIREKDLSKVRIYGKQGRPRKEIEK